MSSYTTTRDLIVTFVDPAWKATHSEIPVFYEDTEAVSLDDVGSMFLTVSIPMTDAVRMGMDAAPCTEVFGEIVFRLFTKAGGGVRSSLVVFDYLTTLMKYRRIGDIAMDVPVPGRTTSKDNWTSRDLVVSFRTFQP